MRAPRPFRFAIIALALLLFGCTDEAADLATEPDARTRLNSATEATLGSESYRIRGTRTADGRSTRLTVERSGDDWRMKGQDALLVDGVYYSKFDPGAKRYDSIPDSPPASIDPAYAHLVSIRDSAIEVEVEAESHTYRFVIEYPSDGETPGSSTSGHVTLEDGRVATIEARTEIDGEPPMVIEDALRLEYVAVPEITAPPPDRTRDITESAGPTCPPEPEEREWTGEFCVIGQGDQPATARP